PSCEWVTRLAVEFEFSVLRCAMELISALTLEVSSMVAACSEDPWASDWLDDEACWAAEAICSGESANSFTLERNLALIWRTTRETATATQQERISSRAVIKRPLTMEALAAC